MRRLLFPVGLAAAISLGWAGLGRELAVPCGGEALPETFARATARDWVVVLVVLVHAPWLLTFLHWAGCVFAGVSLFAVARRLHIARAPAAAAGLLFGLSPFAFAVAPGRPGLSFYGVLPWAVLAGLWLARKRRVEARRLVLCIAIAVIAACSHLELALLSGALIFLGVIVHANRTQWLPTLVFRLAVPAAMCVAFAAVHREAPPDGVPPEHYGLKVSGFFVGGDQHRAEVMRNITANELAQALVPEETGGAYLGVMALLALAWLTLQTLLALARRKVDVTLAVAVVVALVVLAAAPGGALSAARLLGYVVPVRGSHASVLVQALLLLYGAWALRRRRGGVLVGVCAVAVVLGVWDQLPVLPEGSQRCRPMLTVRPAPGEEQT